MRRACGGRGHSSPLSARFEGDATSGFGATGPRRTRKLRARESEALRGHGAAESRGARGCARGSPRFGSTRCRRISSGFRSRGLRHEVVRSASGGFRSSGLLHEVVRSASGGFRSDGPRIRALTDRNPLEPDLAGIFARNGTQECRNGLASTSQARLLRFQGALNGSSGKRSSGPRILDAPDRNPLEPALRRNQKRTVVQKAAADPPLRAKKLREARRPCLTTSPDARPAIWRRSHLGSAPHRLVSDGCRLVTGVWRLAPAARRLPLASWRLGSLLAVSRPPPTDPQLRWPAGLLSAHHGEDEDADDEDRGDDDGDAAAFGGVVGDARIV